MLMESHSLYLKSAGQGHIIYSEFINLYTLGEMSKIKHWLWKRFYNVLKMFWIIAHSTTLTSIELLTFLKHFENILVVLLQKCISITF